MLLQKAVDSETHRNSFQVR